MTKDYYTFGSPMPGRKYQSSTGYRYGFNGKENDKETVSTGDGTQDYGFRIYNPSLGRFFSTDPLSKSYPMLTPYQFASNTPIQATDLDGLEANYINIVQVSSGQEHYKDGYVYKGPDERTEYTVGTTKLKGPNARDNFNQVNEINININKYGEPQITTRSYPQRRNPISAKITEIGGYVAMDNFSNGIKNLNTMIQGDISNLKKSTDENTNIEVTEISININGITDKKELASAKKELTKYAKSTFGKTVPVKFTTGESSSQQTEKDGSKTNTKSFSVIAKVKETTYEPEK